MSKKKTKKNNRRMPHFSEKGAGRVSQRKSFSSRKKKQPADERKAALFFLFVLLIVIWVIFGIVWRLATRISTPEEQGVEIVVEEQQQIIRRLLDGQPVASSTDIAKPVMSVIVDHNHDAFPISGIDKASVVYEAPAEGGITRLLVLYNSDSDVKEVGPIRSARPYFLDWASEYGAMFLHVGGSPAAMDNLEQRNDLINLDQYYDDKYSWRDLRRYAPHNTYTSSDLWQEALEDYGMTTSSMFFSPWKFEDKSKQLTINNEQLTIKIPSTRDAYGVQWIFQDEVYKRLFGDGEYRTRDGNTINADTIIVQQAKMEVLDAEGRLDMQTIGSGTAWFFRDGVMQGGLWKKDKQTNRTKWFDAAGNEISLKPGKIWVHIVPLGIEPIF